MNRTLFVFPLCLDPILSFSTLRALTYSYACLCLLALEGCESQTGVPKVLFISETQDLVEFPTRCLCVEGN